MDPHPWVKGVVWGAGCPAPLRDVQDLGGWDKKKEEKNNNWGKRFPAAAGRARSPPAIPSPGPLPPCQAGSGCGAAPAALEGGGSDQHAGALQGVAGPLEVVPADAVQLADVVLRRVVNAVQVGEAAGVEPPACREGAGWEGGIPGGHPWVLRGCLSPLSSPPPATHSPPDSIWAHLQRQLSLSASRVLKRVPCSAMPLCCPAVPL